jgi:catechol 2,3-dioxygenase-like lactoylglutathione lyase family enzyme
MASYKLSNCVCMKTPDLAKARAHFLSLGMTVVSESEDSVELSGGEVRLFIDRGEEMGPIMELLVPDLEEALEDLGSQGWSVVLWEGRGGRCYLRNPLGMLFNLSEDAPSFEAEAGEGGD